MKNNIKLFEFEDRFCPICGNFIKSGSPLHRCLDEDIKKLEEEEIEEIRTYDDKLIEFEDYYTDKYYDKDIEEE